MKELHLRGLTGASVLAIERGEGEIVFPNADEVLRNNDIVVLTGTQEAVSAASQLLCQPQPAVDRASDGDLMG